MNHRGNIRWLRSLITSAVVCSAVAGVGLIGSGYLYKESRTIAQQTLPALSYMALANQFRSEAFLHLICAINARDAEEFKREEAEVHGFSDQAHTELTLFRCNSSRAETNQLFDKLMIERVEMLKIREEILSKARLGDPSAAKMEFVSNFLPVYDHYLDDYEILINHTSNDGIAQADRISVISCWTLIFTFISCMFIFIFGFFLGYTR